MVAHLRLAAHAGLEERMGMGDQGGLVALRRVHRRGKRGRLAGAGLDAAGTKGQGVDLQRQGDGLLGRVVTVLGALCGAGTAGAARGGAR